MNKDQQVQQITSMTAIIVNDECQKIQVVQDLEFLDLYNLKTTFSQFQQQQIMECFNIQGIISDQQALNYYSSISEGKQTKSLTNVEQELFSWIFIKLYEFQPFSFHSIPPYVWHKISQLLHRPLNKLKLLQENILKSSVYQLPWSKEEDQCLSNLVSQTIESSKKIRWTYISQELQRLTKINHTRLPRQCRERWLNQLNPKINRMPWTQFEKNQLTEYVKEVGRKWALIAKKLNRNENQVKNTYNAIIKKTKSSKDKKENSISSSSNIFKEQTFIPEPDVDYGFAFVNLSTKALYLCDNNLFQRLLNKKESQQPYENFLNYEQEFFTPFNSQVYFDNQANIADNDQKD